MSQIMANILVPILLVLVLVAEAGASTPPGIAKGHDNGHASCKIKKYKHCYNLVHVCPKFCPNECTVECVSCKPICVGGKTPSPDYPTPSLPTPSSLSPKNPSTPKYPSPSSSTPSSSSSSPNSPSTPKYPSPSSSTPSLSSSSSSSSSSASSSSSSSPNSSSSQNSSHSSSIPSSSSSSSSSSASSSSSPNSSSTPQNNPPSSSTPSSSSSSPSSSSSASSSSSSSSSPKTATCRNKNYPKCYNMEHGCPNACPGGCEVDCNTCKPICKCDKPGAVCQDPRFIGGDGITFYFHGKKDNNFCLVSDTNLHINAHFIGRRNQNMKRDFTWVQSIAILFDNHQLFLGAQKTATWDDSVDRLALSFNGEPITLHESEGTKWESNGVSIVRETSTNNIVIEVEGKFMITAKVVSITEEDSRVHSYGITKDDCFAHLDLGFKFYSLSNEVSGVLGQTYKPDYVSNVNIGAKMPIMGGAKEYQTTTLFSPDCSVTRFIGNDEDIEMVEDLMLPNMSCTSGIDGQGVVCRR